MKNEEGSDHSNTLESYIHLGNPPDKKCRGILL